MRPQAVISKQWQLLDMQIYSKGNYLFNLKNRHNKHVQIILWNGTGWCDKRGRNDQGTKWPGDEMTGYEMTRGQTDQDEMTGDEMKGDES
jgi:hypothetical protein